MYKGVALSIAIALIVLTSVTSIGTNTLELWWFVPSLESKLEIVAIYRYNLGSLAGVYSSAFIIINGTPYLVVLNQSSVEIIDLARNATVKTLTFNGSSYVGPVVAGNGTAYIFVYDSSNYTETIYDMNGNKVYSYSIDYTWLLEPRYDWYRDLLYFITMYRCDWYYCYKVLAVSTKTGNVTLSIDTGEFVPEHVAFNSRYIYILLSQPSIWVVDASTGNVVSNVNVNFGERVSAGIYASDYGVVVQGYETVLFRSLDLSNVSDYLVIPAPPFSMIIDARSYLYGIPVGASMPWYPVVIGYTLESSPNVYVIDSRNYAVGLIRDVYAISTDAKLLSKDYIALYDPSTNSIIIARPAQPKLFTTTTTTVTKTQTVITTVTQYPSTPSPWLLPAILLLIALAIIGILKIVPQIITTQKTTFVKKK